jgi:hypothetical protein
VLGQLEQFRGAAAKAESPERGYVITGDDGYLQPVPADFRDSPARDVPRRRSDIAAMLTISESAVTWGDESRRP